MKSPEVGQKVSIQSMGKKNQQKIKKVSLLGYSSKLKWKQTADALEITAPDSLPFQTAVTFRIE